MQHRRERARGGALFLATDPADAAAVAVVVPLFFCSVVPEIANGTEVFACANLERDVRKPMTEKCGRTELYAARGAVVGYSLPRVALSTNNLIFHVKKGAKKRSRRGRASFTAYRSIVCAVGGTRRIASTDSSASLWQWRHQYSLLQQGATILENEFRRC